MKKDSGSSIPGILLGGAIGLILARPEESSAEQMLPPLMIGGIIGGTLTTLWLSGSPSKR
jgi:hypothetical protein